MAGAATVGVAVLELPAKCGVIRKDCPALFLKNQEIRFRQIAIEGNRGKKLNSSRIMKM